MPPCFQVSKDITLNEEIRTFRSSRSNAAALPIGSKSDLQRSVSSAKLKRKIGLFARKGRSVIRA